ncbi:MAG: hypothetical protein ACRD2W_06670 [Acidimicrobiales bacterium]
MFEYTPNWTEWMYVFAPLQIYCIIVIVLACYGDHGSEGNVLKIFFKRISDCLEKWTGYQGWVMAGGLTGLLMLGTAAIGFYWDVAFHVDNGRDNQLFTPSHTMIVIGLAGLVFAATIAVLFASLDKADVALKVGPVHVPWTALTLAVFGFGGLVAFPFDAMWHEAYGVDVTLWSPSHIQLVMGASLATVVLWLMIREGGIRQEPTLLGRGIQVTMFGAILVGLSTLQGEFDFGVPQFQVLYLPILIAVAAGIGLVLGRLALGPWGAVKTVLAFLIIRSCISLLVAGPFNMTFPKFPLYIVAALAVEGVAYLIGTHNRLLFAAAAGAAAGTVGVFADLIYLSALSPVDAGSALLPKAALFSPIAGIAGALLGAALARPMPLPVGGMRAPAAAVAAAGLVLVGVLLYPLPRNVGNVQAEIFTKDAGNGRVTVEVQLTPADAADNATAFGLQAWQGGAPTIGSAFEKVGPGRYVSARAVPASGRWKTVIGLQRSDEVMAAPIYLPADPEIGAPEVPLVAQKTEPFARNTTWLLRETKPGAAFAANAAYTGVGVVILAWIGLYALCAIKLTPTDEEAAYARSGDGDSFGFGGPPPPPVRPQPSPVVVPERQSVGASSWGWGERFSGN